MRFFFVSLFFHCLKQIILHFESLTICMYTNKMYDIYRIVLTSLFYIFIQANFERIIFFLLNFVKELFTINGMECNLNTQFPYYSLFELCLRIKFQFKKKFLFGPCFFSKKNNTFQYILLLNLYSFFFFLFIFRYNFKPLPC